MKIAVFGLAHLKSFTQLSNSAIARNRGRQKTTFGGTGLKLAYAMAALDQDVTFVTVFADTGINSLIADAMGGAGISVRAEFHGDLPECGETIVTAEDGMVIAHSIAGAADTMKLREAMVSSVVDDADVVLLEASLHRSSMRLITTRSMRMGKSCWIVAGMRGTEGQLLDLPVPGSSATGMFLWEDQLETLRATAIASQNTAFHSLDERTRSFRGCGALANWFRAALVVISEEGRCIRVWRPGDEDPSLELRAPQTSQVSQGSHPSQAPQTSEVSQTSRAEGGEPRRWGNERRRIEQIPVQPMGLSRELFETFIAHTAVAARGGDLVGASRAAFLSVLNLSGDTKDRVDPLEQRLSLLRRDRLTGLIKVDLLPGLLKRIDPGKPMGLILIDIDHFKKINDGFGHATGDKVLQAVGGLLLSHLRTGGGAHAGGAGGATGGPGSDEGIRYGGEELVILLQDVGIQEVVAAAERLRKAIEGHAFEHGRVTCSMGVTVGSSAKFEELFAEADKALYVAKNSGRNQVQAAERFALAVADIPR